MSTPKYIQARWVLPVEGSAIENGEVIVDDGLIVDVRAAKGTAVSDVFDLGDAILLPGLVNVHTHLDYTVMRGLLEDIAFFPWIRELTLRKAALTWEDWVASATMGAAEAVAGGVTTIGDCTDSGAACEGAKTLGLRGIVYQEVFGIDELRTVEEIIAELNKKVDRLRAETANTLLAVGISPHAPYTVRPALMQALSEMAQSRSLPVCIHAAESRAEAELLRTGTGVIAEMFARRGIQWNPPGRSTVAYLDDFGIIGPRTLLVHGVQVSAGDRSIVRERGAAWAHCPKSNAKLGNGVAPLGILADFRHGENQSAANPQVCVGLGSDSVASNNTMDLFEEMRFAVLMHRASRHRIEAMTAREAVEMATMGGARALNLNEQIGSLVPGKRADLCAVRLNDLHTLPAYDPYNALVYTARASDVILTMIDGVIRYDARAGHSWRDRFPHNNLHGHYAQLQAASSKMRDWTPPTV
jgi:cytosine/adenosine deaminase-related metal-dependent hydrolase